MPLPGKFAVLLALATVALGAGSARAGGGSPVARSRAIEDVFEDSIQLNLKLWGPDNVASVIYDEIEWIFITGRDAAFWKTGLKLYADYALARRDFDLARAKAGVVGQLLPEGEFFQLRLVERSELESGSRPRGMLELNPRMRKSDERALLEPIESELIDRAVALKKFLDAHGITSITQFEGAAAYHLARLVGLEERLEAADWEDLIEAARGAPEIMQPPTCGSMLHPRGE